MRCYFCGREDFETFDEVQFHIVSITVDAEPQCKYMTLDRIRKFDENYTKYH